MKITILPNDRTRNGPVAFISWDNQALRENLSRMFYVRPTERIVELIIGQDGITAVFETLGIDK